MILEWIENPKTRNRAVLVIWVYDVFKFLTLYRVLVQYDINPWLFFFLDMVTVPAYVAGWSRLICSLGGRAQPLGPILGWSVLTFFTSTAPYLYSAWAGRQCFPCLAWVLLGIIIFFPVINIIKTLIDRLKPAAVGGSGL